MFYLDNNATTRPTDEAAEAVVGTLREHWANPSSVHRPGLEARRVLDGARAEVAGLLGVRERGVIFTGSGTEAISIAIRGVLMSMRKHGRDEIVTTDIEHSAVRALCEALEEEGLATVHRVALDADGRVDPESVGSLVSDKTAVVSVQWVNNETGAIQDIERIGAICAEQGAVFHCDATQWIGKMPTALEGDDPALGSTISVATASAHKFHGPKGVGICWVRRGVPLVAPTPGAQERGRRGGTEGLPAIAGAGVAAAQAAAWLRDHPEERERLGALRDRLESGIIEACAEIVDEPVVVNGAGGPRIWNTTNLALMRLEAEALLMAMSERGLCASAGAACSSGSLDPSPVLLAMGIEPSLAHGSVRLSLSRFTTQAEIDGAIGVVRESVRAVARSMV